MSRVTIIACLVYLAFTFGGRTNAAEPVTVDVPLARPSAATFSADGKQIAVGGLSTTGDVPNDGVVLLLDAQTGQQQQELRHSGTVNRGNSSSSTSNMIHALAYSPDGKSLAVAAELGLKLWNPMDGKELATFVGYELPGATYPFEVTSAAFSPDGKLMAISRSQGKLELWDVQARQSVREIDAGSDAQLAFSRDGSLLVSAEQHNRVHLWNPATGEQLAEVHAQMGPLYGVAIDANSKFVVAVGEGGEKMWRIEKSAAGTWKFSEEVRLEGQGPMSPVRGVSFSPDSRLLATFSDSGVTLLYDAATKAVVGSLWAGGPTAFSPDGKRLAVAQTARQQRKPISKLTIWNVADVVSTERLTEQALMAARELVGALKSDDRNKLYDVQPRTMAVLGGPQAAATAPLLVEALPTIDGEKKTTLVTALGRLAKDSPAALDALIKTIRDDKSADARAAAAMGLAMYPPNAAAAATAIPVLSDAVLKDESPDVQRAAAMALKQIDPSTFQTVVAQARARGPLPAKVEKRDGKLYYQGRSLDEWIDRLAVSFIPNEIFGRPSPNGPLSAIRAFGADAVPPLVEILKTAQGPQQMGAAAALGALGSQAAPAVDLLLDIIAKPFPGTANAAADAVAAILKDQKQVPARLVELANSNDPTVRLTATRAVAQIDPKHPRGLPVLNAALAASANRARLPMMMAVGPMPEPTSAAWLGKLVADNEAPAVERMRAAESLERMKDEALPALPALIRALQNANDDSVKQAMTSAIQRLGAKAVPALSEALKAAKDQTTRERLAVALFSMGDEGQRVLKESLPEEDGEAIWWLAACGAMDPNLRSTFGYTVREALEKCGQKVPPPQFGPGFAPGSQPQSIFQRPTLAWSGAMLIDSEAPQFIRIQSGLELTRHSSDELLPMLPGLLEALQKEKNRTLQSQIANIIQRMGPKALPTVLTAIENAPSDDVRRELMRTLMNMGKEGQAEFARLMRNPEYAKLFSRGAPPPAAGKMAAGKEAPDRPAAPPKPKFVVKPGGGPSFDVVLRGKKGQEIKGRVDTASDSFTISAWSDPTKVTWTPHNQILPITLYAFAADGQQYDVPADWNGKIGGWAFLLPTERDLVNVPWNEGVPPDMWKGASFGWGGLRNSAGKIVADDPAADASKRIRYVPAGANGASDIALDSVSIEPVNAAATKPQAEEAK